MTIDFNGADQFFRVGNHKHARKWQLFAEEDKKAAIATARRMITRDLGYTLDDSEVAYVEGDYIRQEYAVYEQALHILLNDVFPNSEGSGPAFIAEDGRGSVTVKNQAQWSTEARRWLGLPTQLTLVKG